MTTTELCESAYDDGHELRACRDAAAAIAVVVRARRWCSAVDLSAVRAGIVE